MRPRNDQRGESLIEVVLSIVLLGIVASAWFVTYSNETRATALNKDAVTADTVLRSYAEMAKDAVRGCDTTNPGTFTVAYTIGSPQWPSEFPVTVADKQGDQPIACPSSPNFWEPLTIKTTFENGSHSRSLNIDLRAP